MEIFSIDNILAIAGLLLGGGSGAFFTWQYQKKKARAEAKAAEAEAANEKQNYYQQNIDDVAKDRDYYKQERDEYRMTIKRYDERINHASGDYK